MGKNFKSVIYTVLAVIAVALVVYLFSLIDFSKVAVLNTKGPIGDQQRDLIIFASLLSLIVIIPVFVMTFLFAWRYRASNKKATYDPDWDHSVAAETIWWGVPLVLITILAVVTWKTSHELDPFKPLESDAKPVTVQVIALDWKWLFLYPEYGIASMNYVQFPEDTPVNFQITADAPMNSFWIPQLGGQIYAMSGMTTKLHLMANEQGSYAGSSANISGKGFADMKFVAKATSKRDFDQWVTLAQNSTNRLDTALYDELAKPSERAPVAYYKLKDKELYNQVVMKFMGSVHETESHESLPSADHSNHSMP